MEYTTVELASDFKHRYKFDAGLYNIRKNIFQKVVIFLDSGCFNTMIPRYFAMLSGHSLGFKRKYRISGSIVEAEAFSIDKIVIGNVALERVVAFAADFTGELESNILIGTNVMNNWEMVIHKKTHVFKFREDPPENLPNKAHIYQNYFDESGNYVCVQNVG